MDLIKILRRIMGLVMLEEDIKKYVRDAEYILQMFDKIDEFYENARDLEPLYHPIPYEIELRRDAKTETRVDMGGFTKVDKDGYVEAPPIKGKKKIH